MGDGIAADGIAANGKLSERNLRRIATMRGWQAVERIYDPEARRRWNARPMVRPATRPGTDNPSR